jgi:molybdate/tungstate transport system substrate-binding protein
MRRARVLLAILTAACAGDGGSPREGPLVVYTAGSLARPMRAALDSFAAQSGVRYHLESAGSLETARKITELGKVPDVIALADEDVFPKVLVPAEATWYVRFATNRLVLAYTERSRYAAEIDSANWWQVLQRSGIETGRATPDLDPAGYRTLMVFQLAERFYRRPGLAALLEAAAPPRNIRPKEIELVALLESGDLDYAWYYESMARASGTSYVRLPSAIDLSDAGFAADYAAATVDVVGAAAGETVTMRGSPIRYAFSIPLRATQPALAEQFAVFLLSPAGRAALNSEHLTTLPAADVVGESVPAAVRAALAGGSTAR